ncbi:MAG: thioredoxin domain-containing protein, partial [Burkholderiaceae bacterium]
MNVSPKHTNSLIHETSPYLLQHAHNPVQWEPWSEHALSLAKEKNQPILLSIGYAACHWCHVMERESFEDETVAAFMSAHFICIKVDREERPDIDHIYMDALQAMTGSGGWPLNIFLLPDGKPFYGGTYFPPIAMPQRASWMDVLQGVKNAFENNYEKLVEQANELTNHIVRNVVVPVSATTVITSGDSTTGVVDNTEEPLATKEEIELIAGRILQQADTQWGGFGNAPKFPQTFVLQMLFRNYYLNKQEASVVHAIRSIDKMIQGGIYDHLAGGFARYSTDSQWQAPHFVKMFYYNAFFISVISEAYQITQKQSYNKVIEQCIHFLHSELCNEQG